MVAASPPAMIWSRPQAALASGAIKAVVLLGVDPEALPCAEALAKVPFTAVLDLFGTEATERADVRGAPEPPRRGGRFHRCLSTVG